MDKRETIFQLQPREHQAQGEHCTSYAQLFIQPDVTFVFFHKRATPLTHLCFTKHWKPQVIPAEPVAPPYLCSSVLQLPPTLTKKTQRAIFQPFF